MKKLTKIFIGAFLFSLILYAQPVYAKIKTSSEGPANILHTADQDIVIISCYIIALLALAVLLILAYRNINLAISKYSKNIIKKGKNIIIRALFTLIITIIFYLICVFSVGYQMRYILQFVDYYYWIFILTTIPFIIYSIVLAIKNRNTLNNIKINLNILLWQLLSMPIVMFLYLFLDSLNGSCCLIDDQELQSISYFNFNLDLYSEISIIWILILKYSLIIPLTLALIVFISSLYKLIKAKDNIESIKKILKISLSIIIIALLSCFLALGVESTIL